MKVINNFNKVTIYEYSRKNDKNEYVNYYKVKFTCDVGDFENKKAITIMYIMDEFETMIEAKRYIRGCEFKGVIEVESD